VEALPHHSSDKPLCTPPGEKSQEGATELDSLDQKAYRRRGRRIIDVSRDPLLELRLPDDGVREKGIDDPVSSCRPQDDKQYKDDHRSDRAADNDSNGFNHTSATEG